MYISCTLISKFMLASTYGHHDVVGSYLIAKQFQHSWLPPVLLLLAMRYDLERQSHPKTYWKFYGVI